MVAKKDTDRHNERDNDRVHRPHQASQATPTPSLQDGGD